MSEEKVRARRMYRGVIISEEDHEDLLEREPAHLAESCADNPSKAQFYRGVLVNGGESGSPGIAHSNRGTAGSTKPLSSEANNELVDYLQQFRASIERLKHFNDAKH